MSLLRLIALLIGGATNDRVLFPAGVRVRHLLGTLAARSVRGTTATTGVLGTTPARSVQATTAVLALLGTTGTRSLRGDS
jgi:hypothetical protein